jgi:hypothetical protein
VPVCAMENDLDLRHFRPRINIAAIVVAVYLFATEELVEAAAKALQRAKRH